MQRKKERKKKTNYKEGKPNNICKEREKQTKEIDYKEQIRTKNMKRKIEKRTQGSSLYISSMFLLDVHGKWNLCDLGKSYKTMLSAWVFVVPIVL